MTQRPAAPPGADHTRHDRLLVSRLAHDDLYPGEAAEASALVERCSECASLVTELQALSHALREVPSPRRTRDFQITEEQARTLRGSALERLLRRVGSPSLGVLQPLAGAAMSIGLVLAVAGATLPSPGSTPTGPIVPMSVNASQGPQEDREPSGSDAAAAAASPGQFEGAPAASPEVRRETPPVGPGAVTASEGPRESATEAPAAEAPAEGTPTTEGPETGVVDEPPADGDGGDLQVASGDETGAAAVPPSPQSLLIVFGLGLAVVGLLLLILRFAARRVTADRLLR